MNLKELKERYKEFEEVIRKLQEIEGEIARVDRFTTACVSSDSTHALNIILTNDKNVEKIKAVVLDILRERSGRAIADGTFLIQSILESLNKIGGE